MKRTITAIIVVLATLASCNTGGNQKVPFEEVNIDDFTRDSTVYGFCGSGSGMNTLQIITDTGDTLTLSVERARSKNMVYGGYAVSDEMAVIVNSDSTEAIMVINKSALLGDWVMPNPIDGSNETGISFLRGGAAESIDQSSIIYKSWKLYNGKLQIVATRDDGIDMEESVEYTIKKLTSDSLVIETGAGSDLETLEFGRQRPENDEDLGVELDWGDEEDYRI